MRNFHILLKVVLATIIFTLPALPAVASQCPLLPIEKQLAGAEVIFEGKITKREYGEDGNYWMAQPKEHALCGAKIVTLQLSNVWKVAKGSLDKKEVLVYAGDGCMGTYSYFEEGHQYLVFANRDPQGKSTKLPVDYIATDMCGGSQSLEYDYGKQTRKALQEFLKLKGSQ